MATIAAATVLVVLATAVFIARHSTNEVEPGGNCVVLERHADGSMEGICPDGTRFSGAP